MRCFSDIGQEPLMIKSIGVELQPIGDQIIFRKILNDDYIINDPNNPIFVVRDYVDIQEYHENKFSIQEGKDIKEAAKKSSDPRLFFGNHFDADGKMRISFGKESLSENNTVFSLLNRNKDLTFHYDLLRNLRYIACHDLYHTIEADGKQPAYISDSNKVFAIDLVGIEDKYLVYHDISGVLAVTAEFTTAFCELAMFNPSQVVGFSQTLQKVIDTGQSQFISLLESAQRIKKTILPRQPYQNYKKLASSFVQQHANNEKSIIYDLLDTIKSQQPQILKEVFQIILSSQYGSFLSSLYRDMYIIQRTPLTVKGIIEIVFDISFHMSRQKKPKDFAELYKDCSDIALRFAFVDDQRAIDSFCQLVKYLEGISKKI